MSYSWRIDKSQLGVFLVVNRLNEILSISGITRNSYLSDSIVVLIFGRSNHWLLVVSYRLRLDSLNCLTIFGSSRFNEVIVSNSITSNELVSRVLFVGVKSWKSLRISFYCSISLFNIVRLFTDGFIKNCVLGDELLMDRDGLVFGVDFRFSNFGLSNDLRF